MSAATTTIVSHTNTPYALNGFQSLSNKAPLTLRTTGSAAPRASLNAEYVVPRWNPIIDVLAVPEGKALRLVRLSGGQTIWRRTPSDNNPAPAAPTDNNNDKSNKSKPASRSLTIRAIAWHPSGSRLAVLHANGTLVHRDLTRGDIVHESGIAIGSDETMVDMQWVSCQGAVGGGAVSRESQKQPLEFYLPRLSPLDKSKSAPDNINPANEQMTAIVATTNRGTVWVSLSGIFALPAARLPDTLDPANGGSRISAVGAHLSKSSAYLFVKLLVESTNGSRNVVLKLGTPMLNTDLLPSPTLHSLAALSARLSGLCLYLENAAAAVVREIEAREASASRRSLYRLLEGVLQDHGVDEVTSPEAEIIRLAVTGRASESTAQFLLSKLKTTKLNSWESASRLGAAVIIRLVYQHVLPALERMVLAATRLLDLVLLDKTSVEEHQDGSSVLSSRASIVRAIVILTWLYSRMEECMVTIRDEQRENQEFADWALFSIEDLQWQNEGSRRVSNGGHEDADADDGSRPVRPEIEYRLLLGFIRSAFSRQPEDILAAGDATVSNPATDILVYNAEKSAALAGSRSEFVQTYFDLLVDSSNPSGLDFQLISSGKGSEHRVSEAPFNYAFDSQELLDSVSGRCGYTDTAPTCQEALAEVKELLSQALEWPSQMLGQGLCWQPEPVAEYGAVGEASDGELNVMSDTYELPDDDAKETIYIATCTKSAKREIGHLELLCITRVDNLACRFLAQACSIELAVKTQEDLETKKNVNVAGVKFFDEKLLGIVFTVDGCSSTFLGSVDYRSVAMEDVSIYNKTSAVQSLDFERLLDITDASSKIPSALAVNGRKGRRCIAVVERRGRYWRPYDMDNIEEDVDEDEDEVDQ